MKKPALVLLFIATAVILLLLTEIQSPPRKVDPLDQLKERYSQKHVPSVDHSKLIPLQRNFKTPQEVTETCISCHTERHKEVMNSNHWRWEREEYVQGRGIVSAGKKNLINNFCIGIGSNEQSCTKCHAGYGWKDGSFDFNNSHNIDCLVCHDQSLDYVKGNGMAGYPLPSVDLGASARSVGIPTKANCGACHFYGGGGNNVKHGDLEEAILETGTDVDVHMGNDGINMECIACHVTDKHQISGQMYSVSSMNHERVTCEQCHTSTPHENNILNEHTLKVACQTCHIPIYAKANATKMYWDWSTAGKLKDEKPYAEEDEDGNHTYLSIKGSFVWKKNVKPEYVWFDGTAEHYFLGDKVDPMKVVKMNTLHGDYRDPDAKIIPVKIHRAKQIYDCDLNHIIQPKLFSEKKGGGGYWKDFDWSISAKLGMEAVDSPYSGKFCFVNTEMYWPLNHMVSKKEKSLTCKECHRRNDGRLANLQDFYMPGRNYNASIDTGGVILILLSLAGVLVHLVLRLVAVVKAAKGRES